MNISLGEGGGGVGPPHTQTDMRERNLDQKKKKKEEEEDVNGGGQNERKSPPPL